MAFCGSTSAFQARSVDVQATGGTRISTAPGKLLTLSFKVTNTGSWKKTFEAVVVPPAGWRLLAKGFPFELATGAADIKLVSVAIPAEAPAGDYTLRYTVRDATNLADAAEVGMTIVITAVNEQTLKPLDAPRMVLAGESYQSTFLLSNKGNITSRVQLTAISSNGFAAIPDSAAVHLKPGESRTIVVTVKTDGMLPARVKDILELAAEMDPKNVSRANSYVDVVPRVTGTEERYLRLPIVAKVRFAGSSKEKGAQLDVEGAGPLSRAGDDRLTLLIRTPDIQRKSILGRRDEYQLGYSTKRYNLFVGDKNYNLSPLTEFNRYAFGASGDVDLNAVTLGGFANDARFSPHRQREFGGYVNTSLLQEVRVGINYLRKQEAQSSDIVTARSILEPFKNHEIDLEYGIGSTNGVRDEAAAARWTGRGAWYSYDARYVDAGSDFPGYFRDVNLKNLSLTLAPLSHLRFEAYYRDEERNRGRDTTLMFAPRDRYYQVGGGFSNYFSVYYRSSQQKDLFSKSSFDTQDDMWQVRTGFNLARFMVLASADLGTIHDKLATTDNPYKRYSVYTSIEPLDGHTYGFTIEYSDERDPTTQENQRRLSGSFSANVFLATSTQLSLSLFGSRTRGEFVQTYSLFDVSFEHTFPFGHSILLRGRQSIFTPSSEQKEIAYMVEYAVPIGVPIARSTETGQLVGRVVDAEKGTGIPNVLLDANGATAVTDRNGGYSFPALRPGRYVLQMDMASAGLNRVPMQHLPQEFTITGGRESRFDISLSRSVTVFGSVLLYAAQEQSVSDTGKPVLKEPIGHAGAIVELSNAEETNRRLTDNRGRFSFAGIRPGRWTLKISEGNLPENTYFEKDSYELSLAPGESAEMSFKILPRKRRVQIITQGKTIEVAPAKAKPETPPKAAPVQPQKPKVEPIVPPKTEPTKVIPPPVVAKSTPDTTVAKVQPAKVAQPPVTAKPVPETTFKKLDWDAMPARVVFVPAQLSFGIEFPSLTSRRQADAIVASLKTIPGLHTWIEQTGVSGGKPSFRVLAGLFKKRVQAETALTNIRALMRPNAKQR